ncbi:MAG TPA: hypothetical protein VG326_10290 [Tepidisphaeraceae bacterium]|jgi:hypothetical protein|nr:hypothetical protein [Tepidisphaeraceae bacterium]
MIWEIRGTRNGKTIRAKVAASSEESARAKAHASGVEVTAVLIMSDQAAAPATASASPIAAASAAPEQDAAPSPGMPDAGEQSPGYAAQPISYAHGAGLTQQPISAPFGLGLASVICGGVGSILFCIWPVAIPLAIAGITTGIIGWVLARKRQAKHLLPMIGTFVSVIPFVIYGVLAIGLASVFHSASKAAALAAQRAAAQTQAQANAAQSQAVAISRPHANPPPQPPAPPAPDPTIENPISIAADDLISAYNANPVAADAMYKNHWLKVDGTITQIHRASITLNGVEKQRGVQCTLTSGNLTASMALQTGQPTVVRGRCAGGSPRSVNLREVTIAK